MLITALPKVQVHCIVTLILFSGFSLIELSQNYNPLKICFVSSYVCPQSAQSFWLTGFSIRTGVGGNTPGLGGEGTTQVKGMTLGWGCMGVSPTWEILKIWTS